MQEELDHRTWQVIRAYRHLMTEAEWRAERALGFQAKMESGERLGHGEFVQKLRDLLQQELADPAAAELFKKGRVKLLNDAVERILAEHGDKVIRCRKCGGILRTPRAKQCLDCGYDWHAA
jgi:hypothetical protein